MNRQREFNHLFCVLAIGFIVQSANSILLAQAVPNTKFLLKDKKLFSRYREANLNRYNRQRATPAEFQSDSDQSDTVSKESLSPGPGTAGNPITSNTLRVSQSLPMILPVESPESTVQNGDDVPPPLSQFREDYQQYYRSLPPLDGKRFSTDIGANLSGTFSAPHPRMPASEMVVNQAEKIAMLEKMIADCQADNNVLKNELMLTTQALTQTNIAFDELQNQMISVNQQNRSLKVKFEELADTYSRSETEIQQMLNQLRKYVSKELNAANVSSGPPSTNQMVEPGALPNSELLPSPKN